MEELGGVNPQAARLAGKYAICAIDRGTDTVNNVPVDPVQHGRYEPTYTFGHLREKRSDLLRSDNAAWWAGKDKKPSTEDARQRDMTTYYYNLQVQPDASIARQQAKERKANLIQGRGANVNLWETNSYPRKSVYKDAVCGPQAWGSAPTGRPASAVEHKLSRWEARRNKLMSSGSSISFT